MKKLPLHYRLILEAESKDYQVATPPQETPDSPPGWDQRFKLSPYPQNPTLPTPTNWQGWEQWNPGGNGLPPANWPKFPDGTPIPPNPPEGWPRPINQDGTFNPAGQWPPSPGHPIYTILHEFFRANPSLFRKDENGNIPWLNMPLSVQERLFREFGIRIWDMRDNDARFNLDKGDVFDLLFMFYGFGFGASRYLLQRLFNLGLGVGAISGDISIGQIIRDTERYEQEIRNNQQPGVPQGAPWRNPEFVGPWGHPGPPPAGWTRGPNGWVQIPQPQIPPEYYDQDGNLIPGVNLWWNYETRRWELIIQDVNASPLLPNVLHWNPTLGRWYRARRPFTNQDYNQPHHIIPGGHGSEGWTPDTPLPPGWSPGSSHPVHF